MSPKPLLALAAVLACTSCKPDAAVTKAATIGAKPPTVVAPASTLLPTFLGRWEADSTTSMAITGPITLAANSISLGGHSYPVRQTEPLPATSLSALNQTLNLTFGTPSDGVLARILIPAGTPMLGNNTVCSGDTTWLLAVASTTSQRNLGLAFFSSTARPPLTADWLNNTHDLCGTFGYFM